MNEPIQQVHHRRDVPPPDMTRTRGRARRGARLRDRAPFRHAGTQTFIAGLRHDALVAPWVIQGPMDREMFDLWVETQLAPSWRIDAPETRLFRA